MNLITKRYPKTVVVRPVLMIIAALFLIGVLSLIIYNLFYSTQEIHKRNAQPTTRAQSYATATDTKWYDGVREQPPLSSKTSNSSLQNSTATQSVPINPNKVALNQPPSTTQMQQQQQPLTSPITSNQLVGEQFYKSNNLTNSVSPTAATNSDANADPGQQNEKKNFLQENNFSSADYLPATLNNPLSPYELKAGTEISALLIKGIDSDLPGQMKAQVRANVYDTAAGRYILIPQGSTLTGAYDSQVSYGQQRVLVVWQRVIFPNGQSLDLQGMPGSDVSGYSGLKDHVDNHYIKIFTSVILMSGLAAGAQLSQPQQSNNPYSSPTVGQTLAQSLGTNIANAGTSLTEKNLNIPPTLKIRQGYQFNVDVTKDIVFPGPYQGG